MQCGGDPLRELSAVAADATTPRDAALVTPELAHGAARLRRNVATRGFGKQQQQAQAHAGGVGARKPLQRGLGMAELERLWCGGEPLHELLAVAVGDGAGHPLLHYHYLQVPAACSNRIG